MTCPAAPPPGISAPSKASARELKDVTVEVSVLDRRVFLDVCTAMREAEGESKGAGAEFVRLARLMEVRDDAGTKVLAAKTGLFRGEYPVKPSELLYTSVLATTLAQFIPRVGGFASRVLHQVPERTDGKIDICVYAERGPDAWNPVALFEFGLRVPSTAKRDQVVAYGVNVSPQLDAEHVLLAVEVIVAPPDRLDVWCWLRVRAVRLEEKEKIGVTPTLWEGPLDAGAVERLLVAVELVGRANFQRHDSWQVVKNSSFGDGFVWKAYDYRGRAVAVEEKDRRSPEYSLRFIPGCQSVMSEPDFAVIRYPFVEGAHVPSSVGQFKTLIEEVRRMHQQGVVHGDLRASNVVFGPRGRVTVIDFDLAGPQDVRRYPAGFCRDIDDGKRARDASAGRPLLFSHDWYAVAAMMRMCALGDEVPVWRDLCDRVEGGNFAGDVFADLEKLSAVAISSFSGVPAKAGTGSPERK